MIIEGKKNLEFMKRALESHLVKCCQAYLGANEKTGKEKWDPEIAETNKMLDAVQHNLQEFKELENHFGEQKPLWEVQPAFFR